MKMCNFTGLGSKELFNADDGSDEDMDSSLSSTSDSSEDENEEAQDQESNEEEGEEQEEEEEEEDEVVRAIRREKEKPREHPPDIIVEDSVGDISFHPDSDVLCVGTFDGDVCLYKYDVEQNVLTDTFEVHTGPVRAVEFSSDGNIIYTCSKDKTIVLTDTATGKIKNFYDDAHEYPIYSLHIIDEHIFTTGDDDGWLKVWDVRDKKPVISIKKMEDFVSDIISISNQKYLVCSSGDGSLTTFDMVMQKMLVQSEEYDSELNCMGIFKYDTKLLVGSSKGNMYLFNWGEFGLHSDEFRSVKKSINAMVPVTENIVVAAYEDGFIRASNLFPQRQLGIVGQHDFAVEALDISHDGTYIASAGHEQVIKFWNIRYFEDVHVDKKKVKDKKKDLANNLPSSKSTNQADFFSGLA